MSFPSERPQSEKSVNESQTSSSYNKSVPRAMRIFTMKNDRPVFRNIDCWAKHLFISRFGELERPLPVSVKWNEYWERGGLPEMKLEASVIVCTDKCFRWKTNKGFSDHLLSVLFQLYRIIILWGSTASWLLHNIQENSNRFYRWIVTILCRQITMVI